jgi:hypothetical protein
LRDPQPFVAFHLGYRGTRLLLCLFCLPPILIIAVHLQSKQEPGIRSGPNV